MLVSGSIDNSNKGRGTWYSQMALTSKELGLGNRKKEKKLGSSISGEQEKMPNLLVLRSVKCEREPSLEKAEETAFRRELGSDEARRWGSVPLAPQTTLMRTHCLLPRPALSYFSDMLHLTTNDTSHSGQKQESRLGSSPSHPYIWSIPMTPLNPSLDDCHSFLKGLLATGLDLLSPHLFSAATGKHTKCKFAIISLLLKTLL